MEKENMTMRDYAEAWTRKKGETVPPNGTPEWQAMYERWHSFAFKGWDGSPKSRKFLYAGKVSKRTASAILKTHTE